MSPADHRTDIDVLRSFAILPVIAFHVGLAAFSGGYVGVDVFFVISGYLITRQIAADPSRFSLADFYARRARRILPALFTMLIVTGAVATWLLLPVDLKRFGQSMVSTALFSSNILFWLQTGYFDAAAHTKPLLHTWSLAVEEQFYLLYPLVLWALAHVGRQPRRRLIAVTALALCGSFALAVLRPGLAAGDSFYLPHFRAWELLVGALLALVDLPAPAKRGMRESLAAAGIALIAVPVLTYSERTPFPGTTALWPCLGAALIIHARVLPGGRLGWLLHDRRLETIGKISYSLYLWHWPIIVFYRYRTLQELRPVDQIAIVAATAVLAWLSWRYIEQPARQLRPAQTRLFAMTAAACLSFSAIGMALHLGSGFPARFGVATAVIEAHNYNDGTCFLGKGQPASSWEPERCTFTSAAKPSQMSGTPKVLLWGDSHAAHFAPGLLRLRQQQGFGLTQASYASCPPLIGYDEPDNPQCRLFNETILRYALDQRPDRVLLSARWNSFKDPSRLLPPLRSTIDRLRARGIAVILVGESPSFAARVPDLVTLRQHDDQGATRFRSSDPFTMDVALASLSQDLDIPFYSPRSTTCDAQNICVVREAGQLLYWDESHFTDTGSDYYSGMLLRAVPLT